MIVNRSCTQSKPALPTKASGGSQPYATTLAQPSTPVTVADVVDHVDVVASGGLDPLDLAAISHAVEASSTHSIIISRATLEMTKLERASNVITAAPFRMYFPMDTITVDATSSTIPIGVKATTALSHGDIVMTRTSAAVEGAQLSDTIELRSWDGTLRMFTIGAVVDDTDISGAELALPATSGASMGIARPSRGRVWGTRPQLETFLSILPRHLVTELSWSPMSPDDTISQARTKQLLGQFAYIRTENSQVTVDPTWKAANLVTGKIPLIGNIECHTIVARAATDALEEIRQAGLARLIDTDDTYRNGGCWGPREQKTPEGTSGHTLSRHTWGGAIDINPTTNPQGAPPTMDQRVVAISRHHGFAWGGSFPAPDGMHFEYIGPDPRQP